VLQGLSNLPEFRQECIFELFLRARNHADRELLWEQISIVFDDSYVSSSQLGRTVVLPTYLFYILQFMD
jgi:hypothetical protein